MARRRHRGVSWLFHLAVFAVWVLVAPISIAQPVPGAGETRAGPVLLKADSVRHDRELGIVIAKGNVEVNQGDRVLLADSVTYNQRTDTLDANGNIILVEPTGDVIFADFMELSGDLKNGIIEKIRVRLADNSRVAAVGGRRIDGTRIEMRKAVYSPCELCKKDPSRAPTWQVKAYSVVHDKIDKTVEYKDAFIEFFGVPLLYTPYMSHPDPTVKRKSGFLVPDYSTDSELGLVVRAPYYFNIAPTRDATVTPIYTGNEGTVMAAEYRDRVVGGIFEGRGSVTKASTAEGGSGIRGHFDGGAIFDINDTWRGGIKASFSSDDTYLRRYAFGGPATLVNRAYAEGFRGRNYVAANTYYFQDSREDVDQNTTPFVMPMLEYSYLGDPGFLGSRLSLDANVVALTRDVGTDTRRVSIKPVWKLPYVSRVGEVYTLHASVRADGYWVNEVPDPDRPTTTLSGITGRLFPQLGLDWRFPWVRQRGGMFQSVEPIAGFVAGPNDPNPAKVPNEDSLDFELDDTNIFRSNRFTGYDRVEGGQWAYYGLKLGFGGQSDLRGNAFIGQSYLLRENSDHSGGSGLETKFSDLVGRVGFSVGSPLTVDYRFRIDNADLAPQRNELSATFGYPILKFRTNYLFIRQQSPTDEFQDREQLDGAVTSQITKNWSIGASVLRDLATDDTLSTAYNLTYEDSCLTLYTSFTRSFTRDRDVIPTDTLFFRVSLKTLGGVQAIRTVGGPTTDN